MINVSLTSPKGTLKKYVRLRLPRFDHPSPLFALVRLLGAPPPPPPPPPHQGTFVLARTPPLPLNFYTLEI